MVIEDLLSRGCHLVNLGDISRPLKWNHTVKRRSTRIAAFEPVSKADAIKLGNAITHWPDCRIGLDPPRFLGKSG
jgi:hypothetical protein